MPETEIRLGVTPYPGYNDACVLGASYVGVPPACAHVADRIGFAFEVFRAFQAALAGRFRLRPVGVAKEPGRSYIYSQLDALNDRRIHFSGDFWSWTGERAELAHYASALVQKDVFYLVNKETLTLRHVLLRPLNVSGGVGGLLLMFTLLLALAEAPTTLTDSTRKYIGLTGLWVGQNASALVLAQLLGMIYNSMMRTNFIPLSGLPFHGEKSLVRFIGSGHLKLVSDYPGWSYFRRFQFPSNDFELKFNRSLSHNPVRVVSSRDEAYALVESDSKYVYGYEKFPSSSWPSTLVVRDSEAPPQFLFLLGRLRPSAESVAFVAAWQNVAPLLHLQIERIAARLVHEPAFSSEVILYRVA